MRILPLIWVLGYLVQLVSATNKIFFISETGELRSSICSFNRFCNNLSTIPLKIIFPFEKFIGFIFFLVLNQHYV